MPAVQIYIKKELKEQFDKKLEDEFAYAPSRSKIIKTWIEAYLDGRLVVEDSKGKEQK